MAAIVGPGPVMAAMVGPGPLMAAIGSLRMWRPAAVLCMTWSGLD